ARTRDQRQRQIIAEAHGADRHGPGGLLIHGHILAAYHEGTQRPGQRALRADASNIRTAPMASPSPTTVGFPAKIPEIPACSGSASSAPMLSVAERSAASRGLADTSGAFTPNRRVKASGTSMSIAPRGVVIVAPSLLASCGAPARDS